MLVPEDDNRSDKIIKDEIRRHIGADTMTLQVEYADPQETWLDGDTVLSGPSLIKHIRMTVIE